MHVKYYKNVKGEHIFENDLNIDFEEKKIAVV
jgi:hypothetical protein